MCNPGYRLRQLQMIVTKAMTEGEGYDPELAMAALREARQECEHMGLGAVQAGPARAPQLSITLVEMLQQRFEEASAKPFCPGLPRPKAIESRVIDEGGEDGDDGSIA